MAARVARVLAFLAVALVLDVSLAAPASAQRLAFGVTSTSASTFGIVDLATGVSTPATNDEAQVGAIFTADGQYAVRAVTAGTLSVRHMPTGRQASVAADFVPQRAHPRRATIFGLSAGVPARFDERGLMRWDVCGSPPPPVVAPSLELSLDGATLFVLCSGDDLIGLDSDTGAETRRLVGAGAPVAAGLAINASATEVVVARGLGAIEIVRLALASGQTQTMRTVASFTAAHLASTPNRAGVLLTTGRNAGPDVLLTTTLLDAVTLAEMRVLGASRSVFGGPTVTVSPDGGDAFVVTSDTGFGSTATWTDLRTGVIAASTSVPSGYGLGISYVPVPLPPTLAATVTGHDVALSWDLAPASPQVTGYRLVVGSRAGAADLGTYPLGSALGLSLSGVPPGRYYARIHAVNYTGPSSPSSEVVVDVP